MSSKRKDLKILVIINLILLIYFPITISGSFLRIFALNGSNDSSTKLLLANTTFKGEDNTEGKGRVNGTEEFAQVDLVHGENVQDLMCESDEPIEWVYSGGGRPSKTKEITVRTEGSTIQSTLKFQIGSKKSGEYSEHTGSYICRALNNKDLKSSVYMYFNDGVKVFLQENEVREPLYLPSLFGTDSEISHKSRFIVPCLQTNPNVTVTLFRRKKSSKGKKLKQKQVDSATYDPKIGFTLMLPLNQTKINSLSGEYTCVAKTNNTSSGEHNATFLVYSPKPVTLKVTPPESIIYIGKELNFTCESNEPVLIRETESNLPLYDDGEGDELDELGTEDEIEETTEISATSLHVANHIELNPIPGSYGVFQCQTDNDEKLVLHSWKYFVIGKEADELSGLKYSKKKQEIRCRSKSNQPGLLSFVGCATPSECRINRVCLDKYDSCTGYDFPHDNPTRCKTPSKKSKSSDPCTKIVYNGGSGLVRCVAEGIDEIREFDSNGLKPKNTNSDDEPVEIKDSIPKLNIIVSNDLRSVIETDSKTEDGSQHFNLTLRRSSYHFIGGHRWFVSLENGSSIDIVPESETDDPISLDLIHTVIKISNETMSEALSITCEIPLRESMGWKNISVAIGEARTDPEVVSSSESVAEPPLLVDDNESMVAMEDNPGGNGTSDSTDLGTFSISSPPNKTIIDKPNNDNSSNDAQDNESIGSTVASSSSDTVEQRISQDESIRTNKDSVQIEKNNTQHVNT